MSVKKKQADWRKDGDGKGGRQGEKKRNWGRRGACVITSVCSEVKEINGWLMGEYGFANDKSTGDYCAVKWMQFGLQGAGFTD